MLESNHERRMRFGGKSDALAVYDYDKNNRLLTTTETSGATVTTNTYYYDNNGNTLAKMTEVTAPSTGGQPSATLTETGSFAELYCYDLLNRMTYSNAEGVEATYKYRPDGLRFSKTVGSSETVHIWDGANIVGDAVNGAVTAAYVRGIGLIASKVSGVFTYYMHNAHGDVVHLVNNAGTVKRTYDYDAFGNEKSAAAFANVVTVTSGLPESAHPYANNYDNTWTYTHPGAGMLEITFSSDTITERNYDWIYIYDGSNAQVGARYSGNDLAGKTVTVFGDTVKIRLQTDGSITSYGFSLTSIVADLSVSVEKVTVTSGLPESAHPYANNYDHTWTYTHPGAGMLEITFSPDTITERNYDWIYLYDGNNAQVGARYSGNDLAGSTVTVPGDTVKIRLQTDVSITGYGFSLTSIAAIVITGNPVGGHDDDVNPFRFCGEYFDRETGTVYLRARNYNARLGRFTTQDAWEFMNPNDPLSLNLYAYCANNPIYYIDPSGNVYILAWSYGKADLPGYVTDMKIEDFDFSSVDWDSFTSTNTFARAAYSERERLIAQGISADEIIIRRIDSAADLQIAWSEWLKFDIVDQLHLFSHGNADGPSIAWGGNGAQFLLDAPALAYGSRLYEQTINGKNTAVFSNPFVVIYGCNTANGSWAQKFSNMQQVGVYAQNYYGSFSTDPKNFKAIKDGTNTLNVYMRSFDGWTWLTELFGKKTGLTNTNGFGQYFAPQKR